MTRFCLTLARLSSSMWVGAALLFVATSVTEQVHPSFDGDTKDTLALIRFPWYYGMGAGLLAIAAVASFAGAAGRKTVLAAGGCLVAALLVMAGDYVWVYRPLRDLLLPTADGRGPEFDRLHAWSERANAVGLLLSTLAAVALCAAEPRRDALSNRAR